MSSPGASIDTGFAQEKMYAMARQAMRPTVGEKEQDQPAESVSEQMTSLSWEAVEGKDGAKSFDLRGSDAVYLSTISAALAEDEVQSLSGKKQLKFKEKAIRSLEDKMLKMGMECFSHNFFVAELSKMGVGIMRFQLNLLGVEPNEINALMARAKREKIAAVNIGVQQLASEKVLFGIVTGAKIA